MLFKRFHLITPLIIVIFYFVVDCGDNVITSPKFDGSRAMDYIADQVNFGPRVPGSESSANFRDYLYNHFKQLEIRVDSQKFYYFDSYSKTEIEMVNVLASYTSPSKSLSKKILLLAHYDSRSRAENSSDTSKMNTPIDGANDGASGVAVLMEIANKLSERAPFIDIDLLFVDGEDWGKVGDIENYLIGSKEFARNPIRNKYLFSIVIDMVGDKNQRIYREGSSELFARDINNMIFETAKRLEIPTFVDSVKHNITDDHLSLNASGVPSAVIIDFDYEYWHTEGDTPDKCSPQSLENVGNVLLEIIYNELLWPQK